MLTFRDATLSDVALIRSLADGVWQATYADIDWLYVWDDV